MVDRMYDLTKECKTIAEIGCCRGFIAKHELPEGIEQFYLCDSSEIALKHALQVAKPDGYKITTIQMDEEVPKVSNTKIRMENKNKNTKTRTKIPLNFFSSKLIHWIWSFQI